MKKNLQPKFRVFVFTILTKSSTWGSLPLGQVFESLGENEKEAFTALLKRIWPIKGWMIRTQVEDQDYRISILGEEVAIFRSLGSK